MKGKEILLSVRPKYALDILDGRKRYEYRRVIFSTSFNINKVYIYATAPVKKVVGEFKVVMVLSDTPQRICELTHRWGGIGKEDFFEYFKGADKAYAIRIKDVVRYDTPIILTCRPPQSFRYIDALNEISQRP